MTDVLLENVLTFVALLRRGGVRTTLDQTLDFLRALDEHLDLGDREQVRHAGRALLVTRREDQRLFDVLFRRFWASHWAHPDVKGQKAPRAPRHDKPRERPFTVVNYMAYKARHLDREVDVSDRAGTFTPVEVLQQKDFSALNEEELRTVRRLIANLDWRCAERRTRRQERHRHGDRLDLRSTLRHASRHGGVALRLCHSRQKTKRRPLVLLADVSGSMEKLSRLVLQFFYGVSHGDGGRNLGKVEAFLFGTRLTRVTQQLRSRNVDQAVAAAARHVPDWSGGTRIGESLRLFARRYGRRVLRRGAVVVILSDGWERGDADVLRHEMRRLQHRCHRLIWLNPLAGRDGYEPRVEGMAAALPFVDDFLPVHNLQSLGELAAHLASLPTRRRGSVRRGSVRRGTVHWGPVRGRPVRQSPVRNGPVRRDPIHRPAADESMDAFPKHPFDDDAQGAAR